jgi:tetratricopeptide (TPR) repeat protein
VNRKTGQVVLNQVKEGKGRLVADLKKILPLWAGIIVLLVVTIYLLRVYDIRIINSLEYSATNPYRLSEVLELEAQKYVLRCRKKLAELRQGTTGSALLKGDPDLERAKQLVLKSLELIPQKPHLYVVLAELASMEGDTGAFHLYSGMDRAANGHPDEAIHEFDEALKANPRFAAALEEKARVLIATGRQPEAKAVIDELLAVNPRNSEAFYLRARLAEKERNIQEVVQALETSVELDPANIKAVKFLGDYLVAENRAQDAIDLLRRSQQYAPRDANLKHRLGLILFDQGRYGDALSVLKAAAKIETSSALLYFDLARCYKKLGQDRLARLMLEKAIEFCRPPYFPRTSC